MLNSRSG